MERDDGIDNRDIPSIAKGLSAAQRVALCNARENQFNAGLFPSGRRATLNALHSRGLVYGSLTPLGVAVRSYLIERGK